jgi:glycosyltransferase involved in cell wall biosynthesis
VALDISLTILTKNSGRYLHECLEALREFDEVIIMDNGSTDNSLEVASRFANVKIFKSDFIGFGPLKNLAASYAKHDWILNIDSDEILTRELCDEISNLKFERNSIYSFPRQNFYNKRLIKCCGWHPDRVIRIYNRQTTVFSDNLVHESLILTNQTKVFHLKHAIKHYSFDNASELLQKMQRYCELYAKENKGKKKGSPTRAFLHAIYSFFKDYVFQRGFLYGYEGFLISVSNANGVFYKYIMLYEETIK